MNRSREEMLALAESLIAKPDDTEAVVWEKMMRRAEHYEATGERPLPKAGRMCETCPFRSAAHEYRREAAMIPAQDWPCHTDESEHCAGHFAARTRFGSPTAAALRTARKGE